MDPNVFCPACHGAKTRVIKTDNGAEERKCFLCDGTGKVSPKVATNYRKWFTRVKKPTEK